MHLKSFTFNPFDENTYVLYDETKQCVIIDPGCYMKEEKEELISFIENEKLQPVRLLNTHCHIDHVFGNKFLSEKYNLLPECHHTDLDLLTVAHAYGAQWGVYMEPSPVPKKFLTESDQIAFGNTILDIFFTPGHSPGHICFYNATDRIIISGDVLFQMSIGRSDLPGGDHQTLIKTIKAKLFILPDDTKVYPGHGPFTTIGFEKNYNPFLK